MTRIARRWGLRSLWACGLASGLFGCHEKVSLGGWSDLPDTSTTSGLGGATATVDTVATSASVATTTGSASGGAPSTGTVGASGAAGDTGQPPELPACLAAAVPGPLSPSGSGNVATETATDWTWPTAMTSLEWELRVERDMVRRWDGPDEDPDLDADSGYYYSHQFSFQGGNSGFLGIQAEGGYSDPSAQPPVENVFTKIVTFWMSALDAELGDLAESRIWSDEAGGVEYLTIHGKFAWEACRTYRLRLAPHSVEAEGTWYGAWIMDVDAGVETFIGRMLIPPSAGLLVPLSTSRTQGFNFSTACDLQQTASVLHGIPFADGGALAPLQPPNHRFGQVRGCPGSRFSSFDGAVRHELNVHP